MSFKLNISTIASVITLLALTSASTPIGYDTDVGLLNFFARSVDLLHSDPVRTVACFNFYIPLINEIANEYETNFKACQNASVDARAKVDDATLEQRNELAVAAKTTCDLLTQCNAIESVVDVFECYISGGASSLNIVYDINANASQELAQLRQEYYLIQSDEFKCTNASKRYYEEKSAAAYASLNSCILGTSDVPTITPPTIAPEQPSPEPQPTIVLPTTASEITATVELYDVILTPGQPTLI
ncbi:hypothetical protein DOY81_004955 [Sarcophaga bullata]|nr:hypothetical protein DOY81_004955 [Sarcophaga bullata]